MSPTLTPTLFIGHGSPTNAIEDNEFSREWINIGQELPTPKAILCISAHWVTNDSNVTGDSNPKQINDFYGFPQELYAKKYPVVGDIALAKKVANATGAILNSDWGIDHGTWSVLSRLFPKADIPTIQFSLDINKTPQQHWDIAKKLAQFRQEDILIIGSGNVVHNLGLIEWSDTGFDWATKFDQNIKNIILSNDFDNLINYQNLENNELAIPTSEHFLPLLYILALKQDHEKIDFRCEKVTMGSMSMRSLIIK